VAVLDAARLSKAVAGGSRGGVFFLFGDEEHLKEEALQSLIAAHLDPATRDFNLDQLRGSSVDPETLASICNTPPMMAEWRVVVVRETQAFANAAKTRGVIEELVARPLPGLALILSAQLPDRTKAKFYDLLKKNTTAVEFPPLAEGDLPGWLMERAKNDGVTLEPTAARALASAIGSDLGVLTQELAKLSDHAADSRRITAEDVVSLVGVVPRQNRWDWMDSVGEARFADARRALDTLLNGDSGVGLVIGLGTHFIRLAAAVAGGERGLAGILPNHQRWLAGRLTAQARNWSQAGVDAALDDLLRADRLLKTAPLNDRQVLEELLLRLQQRARPAAA
jgi:DNA polymerase-3 subunit delta